MSNKNLSILFTGQGSQYPEMGEDFVNKYNWVKNRYDISSEIAPSLVSWRSYFSQLPMELGQAAAAKLN